MRILLTGASSFTGYWFARALHTAGHQVVAPLRQRLAAYGDGVRADRVQRLSAVAELVEEAAFGSDRFFDLAGQGAYDLLCHHAAQVGDYRRSDYDVGAAFRATTHRMPDVLKLIRDRGTKGVVQTGTFSEPGEGAGTHPLRAFNAYSLAKSLTAQSVAFWCDAAGLSFGKFTLPNPFGPWEEPRFCAHLLRCWKAGQAAAVNTPDYVRDNMHVDLLALAYARFAERVGTGEVAVQRCNPSLYVESQGRFAERFAAEMRGRSGLRCDLDCARQTEFAEPLVRINTDPVAAAFPEWREATAWDAIAAYYEL